MAQSGAPRLGRRTAASAKPVPLPAASCSSRGCLAATHSSASAHGHAARVQPAGPPPMTQQLRLTRRKHSATGATMRRQPRRQPCPRLPQQQCSRAQRRRARGRAPLAGLVVRVGARAARQQRGAVPARKLLPGRQPPADQARAAARATVRPPGACRRRRRARLPRRRRRGALARGSLPRAWGRSDGERQQVLRAGWTEGRTRLGRRQMHGSGGRLECQRRPFSTTLKPTDRGCMRSPVMSAHRYVHAGQPAQ